MIIFKCPFFAILIILPFIFRFFIPKVKENYGDALRIPFAKDLQLIKEKTKENLGSNFFNKSNKISYFLYFIWLLLTLSAMRPIYTGEPFRPKNFGREIILAMDISTSMLEQDYSLQGKRLSRMDAVKIAAYNFLNERQNDKIGLVLFGTRAYLQSPLTFDKKSLGTIILDMQPGMAGRSTSIGDALGLATKTLDNENNDTEGKVIILLTDGENNDGSMSLQEALNLAKQQNIKIYTIGVGNENSLVQSIFAGFGFNSTQDNQELKVLAEETNGHYFRAQKTADLLKIYGEIDKLEKSEYENNFVKQITELYYIPLLAAIISVILLLLLKEMKNARNIS